MPTSTIPPLTPYTPVVTVGGVRDLDARNGERFIPPGSMGHVAGIRGDGGAVVYDVAFPALGARIVLSEQDLSDPRRYRIGIICHPSGRRHRPVNELVLRSFP